jgi:hypothetical protein
MFLLFAIAVPLLFAAGLYSKARRSALKRKAEAVKEAQDQFQNALVNCDGQEWHVQIALDFPVSYQFPLSLTVCDAAGLSGHFSIDKSGQVSEERAQ